MTRVNVICGLLTYLLSCNLISSIVNITLINPSINSTSQIFKSKLNPNLDKFYTTLSYTHFIFILPQISTYQISLKPQKPLKYGRRVHKSPHYSSPRHDPSTGSYIQQQRTRIRNERTFPTPPHDNVTLADQQPRFLFFNRYKY